MNKKILSILLIIVVLIVVFIGLYAITGPSFKEDKKTSLEAKELADKYIIGLVGRAEFNRNYRIDYEKSEDCKEVIYGCYLVYKFLPGDKYGGSEYTLYYNGKSVEIANNDIPIVLPSCEKDLNNCNFTLQLEELREIARKENLHENYFRMIMRDQKILIEVSYCDINTTENRKKILVDPKNSEILWRGLNEECQGIV